MYKVPHQLVAIVMPNPEIDPLSEAQTLATWDLLDAVDTFGYGQHSVGQLLCVKYHGRFYVTTFYYMGDKREAQFEAAKNGFPFIADDAGRPIKVGLLARLYRAIIV